MYNTAVALSRVYAIRIVLLICASLSACFAGAEQRFLDQVFPSVDVETGIQFGVGVRENGPDQPLLMDVYTPSGDTATDRPVIVVAFPGGFTGGSRDNDDVVLLANFYAQLGYVAAAIDYRVIDDDPASNDDLRIHIIEAVFDMRAAIRFFREDAAANNAFGTDGERVFVAGISAGAVMAAIAGVLDDGDDVGAASRAYIEANGGNEGNSSNNTQFSSEVSGILQIAGAVGNVSWIDPGGPPTYAYHEEFDPIVPCPTLPGIAFAEFFLALVSSGACDAIPAAREVGVATEFFLVENAVRHIGYSGAEFLEILAESSEFFFNEVLQPATLASAILPSSRSVQIGNQATVFASVVNATSEDVSGCTVNPLTSVPADFSYQLTDAVNAPVGAPNAAFTLAAGATQSMVMGFEPQAEIDPTDVFVEFDCVEGTAARNTLGLNTVLLSAQDAASADVIGLTTVVDLAADIGTTAIFAVGSANVGAVADITASVDDGGADLPLELSVCLTDATTGGCVSDIGPTAVLSFAAASTASFAVFATATDTIGSDPANNRIFVRFSDSDGVVRGATSTAVRAQ